MAHRRYGAGTVIGAIVLIVVVLTATGNINWSNLHLGIVTTGNGPGGPPITGLSGGTAYCAAGPNGAGVYSAGPGTTAPAGCSPQAQILQVNLLDLFAGAPLAASAYSCKMWVFSTTPPPAGIAIASTDPLTGISGYWYSPAVVAAGAAPTSCVFSGYPVLPGARIQIQVCKDTTPACVIGDYTAQKTVMYCPLPSIVGTGLCGAGAGAGFVPYLPVGSYTTIPTNYFNLPVTLLNGAALANSTPDQIQWQYQNGTSKTAATTCYVKSNAASNCAAPAATSTGRFSLLFVNQGPSSGGGTLPAAPYGAGYASFIPVDLQTGPTARGSLNTVLQLEVKATTGTDMCVPTSVLGLASGIAPVVISKNSATDLLYDYVIPDAVFTRAVDASGNTLSSGAFSATLSWDCSQVYFGGATDAVTLTANLYAYYSVNYVKNIVGSLNPEAVTQNPTAFAVTINQ